MKKSYIFIPLVLVLILISLFIYEKNKKTTLYIYNWTYYTPMEVVKDFEEKFNVNVVIDNFANNDELFSKLLISGSSGYDLAFPSADYAQIMVKLNMLEKIDQKNIPNLNNINQSVKDKILFDKNLDYTVPYFLGSLGIAVNKNKLSDYERNFNIYKDPRIKNKASMVDSMKDVMGAALRTLGYDLNSQVESEILEATDYINKNWKPNIIKFDSESFAKGFVNGEYHVISGYAENLFEEVDEEDWPMIDFFIPPESISYVDMIVIPYGAKNKTLAEEFINFLYEPENYAKFLDEFNFPPTVMKKAEKYMSTTPFYSVEEALQCPIELDIAEANDIWVNAWQRIRYRR